METWLCCLWYNIRLLFRIKVIYVANLFWYVCLFLSPFRDVKPDNILLDEQGKDVNCLLWQTYDINFYADDTIFSTSSRV